MPSYDWIDLTAPDGYDLLVDLLDPEFDPPAIAQSLKSQVGRFSGTTARSSLSIVNTSFTTLRSWQPHLTQAGSCRHWVSMSGGPNACSKRRVVFPCLSAKRIYPKPISFLRCSHILSQVDEDKAFVFDRSSAAVKGEPIRLNRGGLGPLPRIELNLRQVVEH